MKTIDLGNEAKILIQPVTSGVIESNVFATGGFVCVICTEDSEKFKEEIQAIISKYRI